MAESIRFKRQNLRLLLLNPKTQALLLRKAEKIAAACGEGYVARGGPVGQRARAAVLTMTHGARHDNAENNTLVRNLDAGKG